MTSEITFLGMDLFWLIAAAGGGFLGAAIGANLAFGFTGVSILLGLGVLAATGNTIIIDYVAFGPVFGPHIAFAGGVAAAAYAAKQGKLADTGGGKDLNTAMAGFGNPEALLVGAGFGVLGYIVQNLIAQIPWFGGHTDSVALTVMLSGILARVLFGKTGVVSWISNPTADHCWVPWQQEPKQYLVFGLLAGIFGAGTAVAVAVAFPELADVAQILPFAISALCIIIISFGVTVPVTHHMTIIAGLAGVKFMTAFGLSPLVAMIIGVAFGVFAAWLAEIMNRAFHAKGDTHIDPPAAAIWISTLIILSIAG
ncbi:MAG: hypothetical protein Q4P06_06970 [Actinomycetaceae bacterium]|nr:hypothetical protein [Actinomycetaceae bacterium]